MHYERTIGILSRCALLIGYSPPHFFCCLQQPSHPYCLSAFLSGRNQCDRHSATFCPPLTFVGGPFRMGVFSVFPCSVDRTFCRLRVYHQRNFIRPLSPSSSSTRNDLTRFNHVFLSTSAKSCCVTKFSALQRCSASCGDIQSHDRPEIDWMKLQPINSIRVRR